MDLDHFRNALPARALTEGWMMPTHLDRLIGRYLTERQKRGELTAGSLVDLRSRLGSLSASFGNRPVNQFGPAAIDRWLETIGHMRPASRRSYLSTVKTFCRWMERKGHIKTDPTVDTAKVREPRRDPRALPGAVVATLLASQPDERAQVILWMMVGIGLRCCEVARVRVEDYDPVAGTLFIVGKGSHERTIPVCSALADRLERYLTTTGATSGPIVRSELDPDEGVRPATVSQLVVGWMWDCGIKRRTRDGISAHALRHTCLSDVADACGGDMRVVMELGGHANLATASVYQRPVPMARVREAVEGRSYRGAA